MRNGVRYCRFVPAALVMVAAACGEKNDNAAQVPAAAPATETPASAPAAAPAASEAAPTAPASLPAGVTQAMVQEGQQLFTGAGNCYTCHGPDAHGTALAPNLTDAEWLWFDHPPTVDDLVARIKQGVPNSKQHPAPMPPMGGASLTDDQVKAIAAYVAALHGAG